MRFYFHLLLIPRRCCCLLQALSLSLCLLLTVLLFPLLILSLRRLLFLFLPLLLLLLLLLLVSPPEANSVSRGSEKQAASYISFGCISNLRRRPFSLLSCLHFFLLPRCSLIYNKLRPRGRKNTAVEGEEVK